MWLKIAHGLKPKRHISSYFPTASENAHFVHKLDKFCINCWNPYGDSTSSENYINQDSKVFWWQRPVHLLNYSQRIQVGKQQCRLSIMTCVDWTLWHDSSVEWALTWHWCGLDIMTWQQCRVSIMTWERCGLNIMTWQQCGVSIMTWHWCVDI